METAHPSLVSVSANRAEDDRKDMKCRWSNRRGRQARQQWGGKTQTEPTRQSQERGRKETRRCRGSARGDVPGEGEQGRALAREQPNDRQTEPEMSGEIPPVNTFNKIIQLRSVCVCVCVCNWESQRGVFSLYSGFYSEDSVSVLCHP